MARKPILILHTGGTIGMRRGPRGYEPDPGFLAARMAEMPEFQSRALPAWELEAFDPLLDSANMTPKDWRRIATAIAKRHEEFDGFIVVHGTDTMAYSASALSFMLEGLAKPVVLTGSQIPLAEVRSDARENLITSLLIAAQQPFPEVCVFFGDQLYRGNRATKVSASGFRAFDSPNFPPLGRAGARITLDRSLLRAPGASPFRLLAMADHEVAVLPIHPGVTAGMLQRFLAPPLEAAVLHTYGSGNAPDDPDLLAVLRAATARGAVLVNCTQCLSGGIDMQGYATGSGLAAAGVISGYDMTAEAALTKIFFLLSAQLDRDQIRQQMVRNLRGELTVPGH